MKRFYKTILCVALGIATISGSSEAREESTVYLRGGIGRAYSLFGTFDYKSRVDYTVAYPIRYQIDRLRFESASFGEGNWWSINAGYYFLPHLGIDLGLYIGGGQPGKTAEAFVYDILLGYTRYQCNRPVLLNPSLAYRVPLKRFHIVGRTGCVIPLRTLIVATSERTQVGRDVNELSCKFSMGISAALSLEYKVYGPVSLFVEANAQALDLMLHQAKLTSMVRLEKEWIDDVPEEGRILHYTLDYKYDPDNYKRIELASRVPFGHFTAKAGLVLSF